MDSIRYNLVPSSDVYHQPGGKSLQVFAVSFIHASGHTEVYEIEATWKKFKPVDLIIVNYRWILNQKV